jgi:hypothetical protein
MRKLCFLFLLLTLSVPALARKLVTVGHGKVTTAPGIGGYAQIGYAFVKGDVVTIDATAEKQLERMIVMIYPDKEIGRDLATKTPHYTFTMPETGIIVVRFISDRSGTNDINYTVTRMPASNAVQHYNTRVVWQKPPTNAPHGRLIPRRAGR